MVDKKEKEDCCGCGVCSTKCPTSAIDIREDQFGFYYPYINYDKCIHCGKCDSICVFNDMDKAVYPQKAYAAKHVSDETCKNSSSGGMFTAISDFVLQNGGVVYATLFDEKMNVVYKRISTIEKRDRARGSKYIQSDMTGILGELQEDINSNKLVVFFGTPCQVASIQALLSNEYLQNIYYVDLICNGVGAPLIWKQHSMIVEKKEGKRLIDYSFRPKTKGYLTKSEIAFFEDGSFKEYTYAFDKFKTLYYANLITRPSCLNCHYCSIKRYSDITIADFSSLKAEEVSFNIHNGVSSVLINTFRGEKLFNSLKNRVVADEVPIERTKQVRMVKSASKDPRSDAFLELCIKDGLEKTMRRHFGRIAYVRAFVADKLKKGIWNETK